jgi:hypothetical protein
MSDRRLSAKLMPTFADKGCHMASVTSINELSTHNTYSVKNILGQNFQFYGAE